MAKALTPHEILALRMLAGRTPIEGGSWFNACCGFLKDMGYVSGLPYRITETGRAYLEERGL